MAQASRVPEELMARFRSIAMERLTRIDAAWTALVRGEGSSDTEAKLLRDVHTLKGDAKVVGLADASLLCQRLEDLLAAARAKAYRVHEDVDIVVTMTIQFIAMLVRKRTLGGGIDLHGFLKQIEEVMSEWLRRSSEAPDRKMSVGPHLRVKDYQRVTASSGLRLSTAATSVFLEYLRQQGDARTRIYDVWTSLVTGVEEAHRAPLTAIIAGHIETGRTLADDLGKKVRFDVSGAETSVGPETADVLGVVILHALRNAIDHGIEAPAERRAKNKPEVGSISVRVRRDGAAIELSITDDGAGIDVDRVRNRAVERGLLSSDVAPHATDAEVLECVLASGFSTRDVSTEISGRGVGLDAARAAVTEHGGAIRIETTRLARTATIARVPDVRGRIEVLVFESAHASLKLAVPAAFALRRVDEPPTVVFEDELRIPREREVAGFTVEVVGLSPRMIVRAGTRPQARFALRRCIPPESDATEIVWVDGDEVVMMRPELLSLQKSGG